VYTPGISPRSPRQAASGQREDQVIVFASRALKVSFMAGVVERGSSAVSFTILHVDHAGHE